MLPICHAKRRSRRRWGFHPSTCSLCDSALDALVRISSRRAKGYTHEGLCVCFPTHSIFFCFVVIVVFAFESSFRGGSTISWKRSAYSSPSVRTRTWKKKKEKATSSLLVFLSSFKNPKLWENRGERREHTHTHEKQ